MTPSPAPAEPKAPVWKNPWAIAFVVGIVALTTLRFTQQAFLHAPPPGPSLGEWKLRTVEGKPVSNEDLKGKVWVVSLASDSAAQTRFGTILNHTDDLPGILLVSIVTPDGVAPSRPPGTEARWLALTGTTEQLEALGMGHLRAAFVQFPPTVTAHVDAGTSLTDFARLAAFGVVDQSGSIRGFWPDTDLGRGNVINAARLLAKKPDSPN